MLDMQGILKEYLPLSVYSAGVCEKEGDDYIEYLNEYDFSWQPDEIDGDTAQIFTGETPVIFHSERRGRVSQALIAKLNGEALRLPAISFCWGRDQSIMMADELIKGIFFSPILGVTRTPATLHDSAGQERHGYSVLSFHKVLTYARAESRLATIPVAERQLLRIKLTSYTSLYLAHQSLLARWKSMAIKDIAYDFEDKSLNLKQLMQRDSYCNHAGSRHYTSLNAYQNNE
ncbi:hypothetical protein [Motilimonas eburnea]|uniref:hypothetical protein n=1 Tax=Motilimonas eburnea TaxID=1737488 RepID=UPI001E3E011D|nr:hypothetical protein [Motilimonas eburnea]MCE2570370.1 hypothetical protein [Motilimonas eburnea]